MVVVRRGLAASLVSEVGVEIMVDTTRSPVGWRVSPFTVSMPTSVSPSVKKVDVTLPHNSVRFLYVFHSFHKIQTQHDKLLMYCNNSNNIYPLLC